ncbi:Aft1 HRA domain containing protein [Elaphomyces granulatus]
MTSQLPLSTGAPDLLPALALADPKSSSTESKDPKTSLSDADVSQSLAPPPRPSTNEPDYFNSIHNPFSLEPNPFEQSFSNPSAETPGKSLLPPVAAITSPALPGASSAAGYNWSNSLRSGPLSPAMLAGPAASTDYFDSIARGFPTPNESSLRTGLTPGGGGSMFPAPSPNSQAILTQLQNGGATPSTLEFHRTALNAAKKSGLNAPTSNPVTESEQLSSMDGKTSQPAAVDSFTHHDAADAANGLFMLAKGGQPPSGPPFPIANRSSLPPQGIHGKTADQSRDASAAKRGSRSSNLNASVSTAHEMAGDGSDTQGEQVKPTPKGKGRRHAVPKSTTLSTGRRKLEDTTPVKSSSKKTKGNNGTAHDLRMEPPDSDLDDERRLPSTDKDGRKMTDEEKRRNFLERNRVAALKCRQRKKQWLANLQAKVDIFSTENDALTATVTQLREEIVNLKTLLLAHKDCPVSQAQGIGPLLMNGGIHYMV